MKFILPLMMLATPAFAHSGAHMHPHGSFGWVLGLGCMALAATVAWRKAPAKVAGRKS